MRTSRAVGLSLTLAIVLSACGGRSGSTLVPSPQSGSQSVRTVGGVPQAHGDFAFVDRGERAQSAPVHVTVVLNYNHQAELDQLVQDQSNPLSASYHRYLTTEEFNSKYAPTQAQLQLVEQTLRANGFSITHEFTNRTIVDAVATTASVEKTFQTRMHDVTQKNFGDRYTNVQTATIPASIAAVVQDVTINNLVLFRPLKHAHPTPTPRPTPTPTPVPTPTPTPVPTPTPTPVPTPTPTPTPVPTPTPTPTPVPTPTPTPGANCNSAAPLNGPLNGAHGWFATGVAKAFDYPVQHGCDGAGQTVAVEIDTPIVTSDVQTYLAAAGVTQTGTITNVAVDGGGTTSTTDYVETALDVETISGLAPGANIRVYNFPDLGSQHIEDGYNAAVSDGVAKAINSSFGGCETDDTSFDNATNAIAQQGAAKGITFSASSGDSGSNGCFYGLLEGVSAPASDPYFVGVGAVNFTDNSSGALTSITAGSDPSNGFQSGGGVSSVFALPSYQSGVSGTQSSGRNVPDVSLPGVGVAIYAASQGGWLEADGTSWSSPEFVAFMAEANELHNTSFGFVNPTLYSVFKNTGYADYTDVTTGNNGAYNAVNGYDLVTGIGAPKAWALANAL